VSRYQRIVCLTEETTEALYLMGEQARIVGISNFTVRPPEARREKPRVSAFTSARTDKILALKPDLVLGFSDLQAKVMAELVREGLEVHLFNQRSVGGILEMIEHLGAMLAVPEKAATLVAELGGQLQRVREQAARLPRRPKVYFEEWDEPMISAIGWVSELIEIAGGDNCFAELATAASAQGRIITDSDEVIARAPDLIFGAWCGKPFRPEAVKQRPGWQQIPAVRQEQLFEIPSSDILQPGPAALTDGVAHLHRHIAAWARAQGE